MQPPRAPTSAPERTRRRRLEPDAEDVGELEGAEPGREGAEYGLATGAVRGADAWEEQEDAGSSPCFAELGGRKGVAYGQVLQVTEERNGELWLRNWKTWKCEM